MRLYEVKVNDGVVFQLNKVSLLDFIDKQIDKVEESIIEIKKVEVEREYTTHRPDLIEEGEK